MGRLTAPIPREGWGRSKPTKAGGLIIGPSSPLYGLRIFSQGAEKLLSDMSEEEIADMELQAKAAGGYILSRTTKVHPPKE